MCEAAQFLPNNNTSLFRGRGKVKRMAFNCLTIRIGFNDAPHSTLARDIRRDARINMELHRAKLRGISNK